MSISLLNPNVIPAMPNWCPKCGKRTYISRTKKRVLAEHGEVNIFCSCGRTYTYKICTQEEFVDERRPVHVKHRQNK